MDEEELRVNLSEYSRLEVLEDVKPKAPRDDPLYGWHPYQAKKPPNIVNMCLLVAKESLNLEGRDRLIMVDPFAGSGVHGGEALSLGIFTVLLDLCPLSTQIMKWTLAPLKEASKCRLIQTFDKFMDKLKEKMMDAYMVKCPSCGGSAIGLEYRYDCLNDAEHPAEREWFLKAVKYNCPSCGTAWKILRGYKIMNPPKEMNVHVVDAPFRDESGFEDYYDVSGAPKWRMLKNTRINVYDDMYVSHLYTKRTLNILAEAKRIIWEHAGNDPEIGEFLKAVFSSTLHLAKITDYKRQAPQHFYIPKKDAVELNLLSVFEKKFNDFINAKREANSRIWTKPDMVEYIDTWLGKDFSDLDSGKSPLLILHGDAKELSKYVSYCDIVHTDPPYADQVPYLELYAPYFAWLDLISYQDWMKLLQEEIILSDSPERDKSSVDSYAGMFYAAFNEVGRIAKKGETILQLWYACRDTLFWRALVDQLNKLGFRRIIKSNLIPRAVRTWKEVITLAEDPLAAVRSAEILRHYVYTGKPVSPIALTAHQVASQFIEFTENMLKSRGKASYSQLLYGFYVDFLDRFDTPPPDIDYMYTLVNSDIFEIVEDEVRVGRMRYKVKYVVLKGTGISKQSYLDSWVEGDDYEAS